MKKAQRIETVRRAADDLERRKALALAERERAVLEAQTKLEELASYREAYLRDFAHRAASGMNGAGARDYQVFLARLEEALRHQTQILAQERAQRGLELESWRDAARRAAAVGKLTAHWQTEERRALERREQHDTDEHSLQLWTRRTPARGA